MLRAMLLSLLGAAVLAAVSGVPVDNRNHNEEMVTRCIIEVLSSALSKTSAPPITPECRQVLKNSGKEAKDEEKSDNENTKFEVRLLRDPVDVSEAHRPSSREEAGAPGEEDAQGPAKADTEKWTEGGGHSRESTAEPRGSPDPSDSHLSREAKMSEEEEGANDEEGRGEDASEGKHPEEPGETKNIFLNKRNQALAKKKEALAARWDTHSARPSEEKTHSREKGSQESGEETRSQEKHPQEPKSQSQSQEESEESEEDATLEVAKRRTRPRHHHGRSRPDRSQDRNLPSREGEQAPERSEEAHVGMAGVAEKRDHHSAHFRASEEQPDYGEEARSYPGVPAPDTVEGEQHRGRGSEEYRAPRPQSVASREEDKRGHPSLEHRYREEGEEERAGEQGKGPRHRSKGGELAAYSPNAREEEGFLGKGHHRVQESQMDEARRPSQGDWKEQDRDYPNYGEEGARGKWQQPEDLQDPKVNREEVMLRDKYGPYPSTQKKKRLGGLFNPYFDPLQWKNSRFEKKDSMGDNFLEGEEENGVTLNEKNFFPEYSYDWWERKPFSEDVNWGYDKRSFARAPRLDLKRQHDSVAQLDQLLHYRKKSAEFPDFYDSEEQMSPRHEVASERDGDEQRALMEEEEKELENLAAMDLELQKIAQTFSQRG